MARSFDSLCVWGKGAKDRYTIIADAVIEALRADRQIYQPKD